MEKTTFNSSERYRVSVYSSEGIKINTDEAGIKTVLFVNKAENFVAFLGNYEKVKYLFPEESTKIEGTILTQSNDPAIADFALKMVALMVNKEKYNELK